MALSQLVDKLVREFETWPELIVQMGSQEETLKQAVLPRPQALREAAMADTLRQYYLMPWKHAIAQCPNRLPARVLALDAGFAATFNTPDDFHFACRAFDEARAAAVPA